MHTARPSLHNHLDEDVSMEIMKEHLPTRPPALAINLSYSSIMRYGENKEC